MNARDLTKQWKQRLDATGDLRETMEFIRQQIALGAAKRSVVVHAMRAFGELVLEADRRGAFKELLVAEAEGSEMGVVLASSELDQLAEELKALEQKLSARSSDSSIDDLFVKHRSAESRKAELDKEKQGLETRLEALEEQFAEEFS